PLRSEAPDGGQTRLGCRHLHHDVRPVYQLGKAPRFAHRGFGIHCQIWGYLDAGIPSAPRVCSKTGFKSSAARRMSSIASRSYIDITPKSESLSAFRREAS